MTDFELLNKKIRERGLSMTELSRRTGILRATLYNRLAGIGEFTASEIVALTKHLELSIEERDQIFLKEKLH